MGLADVGIDEGDRLAPGQPPDEGAHQGRLARIGSAKQEKLAFPKRICAHHPFCYHVSPVLSHSFAPREGNVACRPWFGL